MARRPFNETVVGMIQSASTSDLELIASFLVNTIMEKNHDAIVEAWRVRGAQDKYAREWVEHVAQIVLRYKAEIEATANHPQPVVSGGRAGAAFVNDVIMLIPFGDEDGDDFVRQ
ncbi:hypothetical protein HY311_03080 [Candidatus Nomurabacteria bacterium]|nr:hypothetical protein [Candidatus Nomurabacteria bacterium]